MAATLTYETFQDFVRPTALVTLRSGKEFWVCNPYTELEAAMDAGRLFGAHAVVGWKPDPILINPANVATIRQAMEDERR